MTRNSLQLVFRSVVSAGPDGSDEALLGRYLTDRDEAAFARIVHRYGRLVWGVCRHLTRNETDAEDAFQATFVVLLRHAGRIRDAGKLPAWLHGVAHRVCGKQRQSATRRKGRERATARAEADGQAVPDSAWDRAVATLHEEVAALPDHLRIPFVLCCLDGLGVTDAAKRLGWKLGTLSGRLTRAKQAVLARLEARGIAAGVAVSVAVIGGAALAPAAAVSAASQLAQPGIAIPSSILQLSHGVIGMGPHRIKLLAAGVLLALGLGLGVGSQWVATAEAQSKPVADPKAKKIEDELAVLKAELEKAKDQLEAAQQKQEMERLSLLQEKAAQDKLLTERLRFNKVEKYAATNKTKKWEYEFVEVRKLEPAAFMTFLQEHEDRGWDYHGTTPMKESGTLMWVFRRPVGGVKKDATVNEALDTKVAESLEKERLSLLLLKQKLEAEKAKESPKLPPLGSPRVLESLPLKKPEPRAVEEMSDKLEIERLRKQLADLTAKVAGEPSTPQRTITVKVAGELPLGPKDIGDLLTKMGAKKFPGEKIVFTLSVDEKNATVTIAGDKQQTDWAAEVLKKLLGK